MLVLFLRILAKRQMRRKALNYTGPYFVDADHINLSSVSKYVDSSDFFTLDVASFIGKESSKEDVDAFVASCEKYVENCKSQV